MRPAPLLHLVWITLQEPADAPALQRDCEDLLAGIPGVVAFAAGPPVDIGRGGAVRSDYHIGLLVGFSGEEAYRGYLDHPGHVELLRRWSPRVAALEVADFADAGALAPDR